MTRKKRGRNPQGLARPSGGINSPQSNSSNPSDIVARKITETIITSGPLPTPEILAQYGAIDPDFPNRIVGLAEREADHRHHFEDVALAHLRLLRPLGVVCATLIALATLGLLFYCIYTKQTGLTMILSVVVILEIVAPFVSNRLQK